MKISIFTIMFLVAAIPLAFADHSEVTIVPAEGSGAPGCEETSEGCYIPRITTVDVGGVAIFSNTDTAAHTWTAGSLADGLTGEFDTGLLMPDNSFEWKAETVGEIQYYCIVHPWMIGTIIVQEAGGDNVSHSNITLETDKKSYLLGEIIAISGVVTWNEFSVSQDVLLTLSAPNGNVISIDRYSVYTDGAFNSKINTNNFSQMASDGVYTIRAMYDSHEVSREIEIQPIDDSTDDSDPYFESKMLSDGTLISIWTSKPTAGEMMEIFIEFADSEHVNYDIIATQDGNEVLSDKGVHYHDGTGMHITAPLNSSNPIGIKIIFLGYGVDVTKIGPIGEEKKFFEVLDSPPSPPPPQEVSIDLGNNIKIKWLDGDSTDYFSTTSNLEERLGKILPSDRFDVQYKSPEYQDGLLVSTKIIRMNIQDRNEFDRIFSKDPLSSGIQLNGNIIDEKYIAQKIDSSLELCLQNNLILDYCAYESTILKEQIKNRVGTHTVTESIIIHKGKTDSKNGSLDLSLIPSIIGSYNTRFENNLTTSEMNSSLFDSGIDKISLYSNVLPKATAQSDTRDLPYSSDFPFLNGFTIGYGYGKSWSYQYDVFDYTPFKVDVNAEVGLGVGLRMPIDVTLRIDESSQQDGITDNEFRAHYLVHPKNIDQDDYISLGINEFQAFEGKEFKIYLGPNASISVNLFGENVFEYSKELLPTPEGKDFVPPLGNKKEPIAKYKVELLCTITHVCIDHKLASVSLGAGVSGEISGDKITFESVPVNPINVNHEIRFMHSGKIIPYVYHTDADGFFSTDIQDLKYHMDLHLIPYMIAGIDSLLLPFDVETQISFPEMSIENFALETHANTKSNYSTEKIKVSDKDQYSSITVYETSHILEYLINHGSVNQVIPNVDSNSLSVFVDNTREDILVLAIPRNVLDATNNNNQDADFFVLVDGKETQFDETATSTTRVLTMTIPPNSNEIEVIGTFVVPEFGTIATMILAAAIISIIAISAKSSPNIIK